MNTVTTHKTLQRTGVLLLLMFSLFINTAAANDKWWKKIFKKSDSDQSELSVTDMSGAFKQALTIGAENVIQQLGREGGFNADEAIRIQLPENLENVAQVLKQIGLSGQIDDLEVKLNRAAENAVPIAQDLFVQSIQDMTFEDVKAIYQGADDSATQYFKQKMTDTLTEQMQPMVDKSLSEVGAIKSLNRVMDKYKNIPFVSSVSPDLTGYVVEKGIDGVFYYLAEQEAAIRKDPVRQTTALLKKVFGR